MLLLLSEALLSIIIHHFGFRLKFILGFSFALPWLPESFKFCSIQVEMILQALEYEDGEIFVMLFFQSLFSLCWHFLKSCEFWSILES
jgi:hypothetical protein